MHNEHFYFKDKFKDKYKFMRRRNPYSRYVAGAFIMIIGAVLLLNNLHLLPFELPAYVFTWKMLLIVIGVFMLVNLKIIGAAIFISLGIYLLMPEVSGMEATSLKALWPVLLIFAGLAIVLKSFNRHRCEKKNSYVKTEDLPFMTSTVIFGGEKKKLSSHDFEGARLTAIFGGIELDLTNCVLVNERTIIDITAVCGGIELTVPKEWNIKIDIAPIMGGVEDRISDIPGAYVDQTKEVIIKGEVVMGGIEIKRA